MMNDAICIISALIVNFENIHAFSSVKQEETDY